MSVTSAHPNKSEWRAGRDISNFGEKRAGALLLAACLLLTLILERLLQHGEGALQIQRAHHNRALFSPPPAGVFVCACRAPHALQM